MHIKYPPSLSTYNTDTECYNYYDDTTLVTHFIDLLEVGSHIA